MRYVAAITWVAILTFWPTIGQSDSIMLVASKDNSIFANNVDNSNGGGAGVFVGTTNSTQNYSARRGLIEFDIASALPVGAMVTEAHLTLYLGQASLASGVRTIGLHRLTAEWGEGMAGSGTTSIAGTGTGFAASVGDATWNQRYFQQTNWTAPGAEGDYISTISASADVGTSLDTPYTWLSTPALVADVQGWLDQPLTNHGWIMIDQIENVRQTSKGFYSRNATEINNQSGVPLPPEWRPTLQVVYAMSTSSTGDYNSNEIVDACDYVIWQKTLNTPSSSIGSGADGNQNGQIDPNDYTFWRARFGNSFSGLATSNVPEPGVMPLLLFVATLAFLQRR